MRRVPCMLRGLPFAAAFLIFVCSSPGAAAQAATTTTASIHGLVTTLGETLLPGVSIRLESTDTAGNEVPTASTITDDRGRFELVGVRPGAYRLMASLDGFSGLTREVVLEAGRASEVTLDLQIAGISETIDVSPVTVEAGVMA